MADGRDGVIDITTATQRLVWGIVAHLIADWLFQNDWMAKNKHKFGAAMLVHGAIHGMWLAAFFSKWAVVALIVLHMLVDTRIPLQKWQGWLHQTREGEVAMHVSIWTDQVTHIACIAWVALLDSRVI